MNPYTAKKVKEATDKMRAELNPYTEKKVKEATDKVRIEMRAELNPYTEKKVKEATDKTRHEERSKNMLGVIKSLRKENMSDEVIAEVLSASFEISKDEALKLLSK